MYTPDILMSSTGSIFLFIRPFNFGGGAAINFTSYLKGLGMFQKGLGCS